MNQPIVTAPGASVRIESPGQVSQVSEDPSANNYSFILNISRLVDADSFTLAPGHELRRANATETAAIKEHPSPSNESSRDDAVGARTEEWAG